MLYKERIFKVTGLGDLVSRGTGFAVLDFIDNEYLQLVKILLRNGWPLNSGFC